MLAGGLCSGDGAVLPVSHFRDRGNKCHPLSGRGSEQWRGWRRAYCGFSGRQCRGNLHSADDANGRFYTSLPIRCATAGVHVVSFAGTVPFTQYRTARPFIDDAVEIVTPAEAAAVVPPISPVYDIVFVGDSITYGATLATPATQASAVECMQSLGTRFNMAMRMSNQGQSGATTVDWLPGSSYFQGAIGAAAALESNQQGQLVFSIMLGANDSAQSGPTGSPVSPSNFLANLQSIVNQFLADYPSAYVFVHYPTWYSTNTHNGAVYDAPGLARLQTYFPEIDRD